MAVRQGQSGKELGFVYGLDNTSNPGSKETAGTFSIAKNIDLIDEALFKTRNGYTRVNTSAWSTRNIRAGLEYQKTETQKEILLFGVSSTLTGTSGILGKMDGVSTPVTIKSSLTDNIIPSLIQFRNRVFVFNGTADFIYDGGATTRQIGITAPTAAPTLTSTIQGSLNTSGSYLFVYTYYNSVTGAESSPSDPSDIIATGSSTATAGIRITLTAGDSTTADTIRVYRTTSGGNTFFLDGTAAISATSYDSIVADAGLSTQLEPDNERLPYGQKFAILHDNRIFVGGDSTNPNRVRYSKVGIVGPMPESYQATDFVDCGTNDGDPIIGLWKTNSQVIVAKERSIGRLVRIEAVSSALETSGSQKYIYEEIAKDITTIGHHAAVNLDNVVLWLGREEIYGTDGVRLFRFGKRIYNTLKTLNYVQGYKFSGYNKPDTKQIIFNVVRSGKIEPDFQLVGHYKNFPEIAWTTYSPGLNETTHPGVIAASFFKVTENNLSVTYFGSSASDGTVYKLDSGTNDNGNGIYMDARFAWIAGETPAARKMFHSSYLFIAKTGAGSYAVTNTFEKNTVEVVSVSKSSTLTSGSNENWGSPDWASFNWASLVYTPVKFHPHKRAYFGRFGIRNTNADEPIAVKGVSYIIQMEPIH